MILYTDFEEEELYLAMLELIDMLRRELGPSIDGLGQNQLPVFIQFEVRFLKVSKIQIIAITFCSQQQFPFSIDLSSDVIQDHKERGLRIKELKKTLATVLRRRFDPPIVVVKKNLDRRVKIQSKSLVEHLKSEQP